MGKTNTDWILAATSAILRYRGSDWLEQEVIEVEGSGLNRVAHVKLHIANGALSDVPREYAVEVRGLGRSESEGSPSLPFEPHELWVSILERAFLQALGGTDYTQLDDRRRGGVQHQAKGSSNSAAQFALAAILGTSTDSQRVDSLCDHNLCDFIVQRLFTSTTGILAEGRGRVQALDGATRGIDEEYTMEVTNASIDNKTITLFDPSNQRLQVTIPEFRRCFEILISVGCDAAP